MDLMCYDTLFFYYVLTRMERGTMSQPRATLQENIKLLLMVLFCIITIAYNIMCNVKSNIDGGMNENERGYPEI